MYDITFLLQKFTTTPIHIQTIESANRRNITIEEVIFQNRMTVTEFLDSDRNNDIEVNAL